MTRLTNKQKVFVEYYLQTWNATEAARLAGYKGNNVTLRAVGHENLTKPHIKSQIQKRISELVMKSDEVLNRLSQQASGTIADFIEPVGRTFLLNIEKLKELGHLVKKIRHTKYGVEIELYSSQRALELLGKHHQLFTEKIQIEVEQEIFNIMRELGLNLDDIKSDGLASELFAAAGIEIADSKSIKTTGGSESED
jgi:phage terminase small subunit